MKQSAMSKNNFAVGKFCAKDMNEFQQAFSRSEEVWRGNVLRTYFQSLIVLRMKLYIGVELHLENLDNQI